MHRHETSASARGTGRVDTVTAIQCSYLLGASTSSQAAKLADPHSVAGPAQTPSQVAGQMQGRFTNP